MWSCHKATGLGPTEDAVRREWKERGYKNIPQVLWGGGLPFSCLPFQVKQIMEEAVTRKFVHEDSSHIISFCGEFVTCGLERWLLSLWAA